MTDRRARWVVGIGAVVAGVIAVAAVVTMLSLTKRGSTDTLARNSEPEPAQDGPAQVTGESSPAAQRSLRAVHVPRAADPPAEQPQGRDVEADAGPEQAKKPELSARDVIPALVAAGETEGIAAFPPPGTDPIKRGIVVPEDFELPPGYVRHYQATDDGKRLEAILMFSPDYEFVDDHGKPVTVPADRIVPPEMAPPGMPIRILEVPKGEQPNRLNRAP